MADEAIGASFRDPSGFVFEHRGTLYRQVNPSYAADYDHLMSSGLYGELVEKGLLVAHKEVAAPAPTASEAYRTLCPERIPFVSYPYEWCFSELRDAALATLEIQRAALRHGMILKDASAYNVQFRNGRPVFIDTLSFARYVEGRPWVAYRQFCQHFLAPLALAAYRDPRLLQMLRVHIDGIPLDLARMLLPARAWWNVHLWIHIRVHARYQRRYAGDPQSAAKTPTVDERGITHLMAALDRAIRKLEWRAEGTEWAEYYDGDSYSEAATAHKRAFVDDHLAELDPAIVWDLGANTGAYSRIAAKRGIETIAFDIDPACVERNYRQMRRDGESHLLPLLLDLTSPSPALGWALRERSSIADRAGADCVMALALVHHLAISNNVPLASIADFFARLAPNLLIEFVPKNDPKVAILLATRADVFPDYTESGFEAAFDRRFEIVRKDRIDGSKRTLYRLRRRTTSSA
jgi:hypothetical protein